MGKAYILPESHRQIIGDDVAKRRNALFDKYVSPYLNMIYKLCIQYSCSYEDVQSNYTRVLANIYKYIETYDSERSIHTWLHITTKRAVHTFDKQRKRRNDMRNRDNSIESYSTEDCSSCSEKTSYKEMNLDNYHLFYNDDILRALEQLKPSHKRAFLLQQAGYKLREIAEIEHKNGTLESCNIETVKSRLFLARKQLKQLLTRDGNRRTTEEAD